MVFPLAILTSIPKGEDHPPTALTVRDVVRGHYRSQSDGPPQNLLPVRSRAVRRAAHSRRAYNTKRTQQMRIVKCRNETGV
jgi:hypothetical protein